MASLNPELNPEQRNAAEAPISPLLIVAGAGTGKTRTLTSRIVHLIKGGTPPERICAITFTNKAAAEMEHRIGKIPGGAPYIGTFHSLGARMLRQECRVFGREPNFAIFDDHDSFDLVKKAVKAVFPPAPKKEEGVGESASAKAKKKKKEAPTLFAKKISEIKNLGMEKALEKVDEKERANIRRVFELYEAALQRNNAFDFDDLIEKPVAMFDANSAILKKYQDKYDAVFVDEYQDINPKQYELIKLLASGHRNLTVVGDDEQTIYTWRYADIKIFLDFDKDWPGAVVHFLEENYRSTGNIIRGASAVVQNNRFRTPKQLWTKQDAGAPITVYEAWGENDEAAWIAEEILKTRAKDVKDKAPDKMAGKKTEIAILYRTNAQSRAIEQALIRDNIPYKIYGGLKFYERREVKDAVAALRYAANKKDEVSRERLEKNLSKRKFAEFREAIVALSESRAESRVGFGAGSGLDPKPTDIIKIFLETFGYFNYLEANFINSDERQENIAELITFASGFEKLPDLLERLSLVQATDDAAQTARKAQRGTTERGASGNDAAAGETLPVHLSTVHLAKGLEFDTVFVAGAAEGLLPHIRSIDNEASLEEERRLMYVAMTRARKNLNISFYGMPSRFISEIPEEYAIIAGDSARAESSDNGYDARGKHNQDREQGFGADEEYVDF